jgi:hypothetical protein
MNKNIKKVILFSGPRHGTNYFVKASQVNNIEMGYELLDRKYNSLILNQIKQKLLKHNVELTDDDIDSLSKLGFQDEKLFFYRLFEFYSKIADLNKKQYCGFKIFFNHLNNDIIKEDEKEIKNRLNLTDIVNHVDKIIVLSRDSKEVAFSFAQAIITNIWHTPFRDEKVEHLNLTQSNINYINKFLLGNFNFFKQIKELSKEQPDKFLFLNYDEFASNGCDKVGLFLDVDIDKNLNPFKKNIYNYDDFFKNHPTLKEFAENHNIIF